MGDATTAPGIDPADLFAPENRRDPHPLYHRVRAEAPMLYSPEFDEWILTRWADCETVLRDPHWSSNPAHRRVSASPIDDIRIGMDEVGVRTLLFLDPPDHTRLRRLVSKAFTPKTIERLRSHVREIAADLLAGVGPNDTWDVIPTLAYPLPVTVICELMGVPLADRDRFAGWSSDASRLLDGDIDEATAMQGLVAAMNFINYFNDLFEERRVSPGDDLISGLLAVEEEGDRLTEQELRSIVLLLFIAGHETTMNLIGNGLFALLSNRDQWDRVVAEPAMVPSAVEELLRFDGPVHVTARIATTELPLGDEIIPAGGQVICLLAAANRDPAQFPDPDRLDIGRTDNHHLTFSHGIHYCLGAALARLEGQVVFETLAQRFPDLQLAAPPEAIEYRDHFVLRGLKGLPVTVPPL